MKRYKVILIGASNVGKSSLVYRFQYGEINPDPYSTIGMAFSTKKMWLGSEQVTIEINDTAGQERYQAIIPFYFRDAKAAILVYDVTFPASATRLRTYWIPQLRHHFSKRLPVIALVGNKIDLVPEEERSKLFIQMLALQKEFGDENIVSYFTSASTGVHVQQLFEEVVNKMHRRKDAEVQKSILPIPTTPSDGKLREPTKIHCC